MMPRCSEERRRALLSKVSMSLVSSRLSSRSRTLIAMPTAAKRQALNVAAELSGQLDQGLNFYLIDILRKGSNLAIFQSPLLRQIWDMLVVLLVPILIRQILLGDWTQLKENVSNLSQGIAFRKSFTRIIEYTEGGNTRMRFNPFMDDQQSMVENTDRNNLLQKAIRMYMAEKYQLCDTEMEANLTPAKKVQMEVKDDPFLGKRTTFNGTYAQLLSFAVQLMPKKGTWVLVDREKQIYFMQIVNETPQGTDQNQVIQTRTVFHIKGMGANAGTTVNQWLEDAFEFFKERKKSEQNTSRFFYVAVPPDSKDKEKAKYFFKQYLLSDQKTFKSLFFPDKEALLKLIDQFTKKEGKFSIEGFPDKLGLLLDGPPGTGKTSLIKALAQYLNRHIVSVNLSRIKTNQELMDLLFDLIFPVQGGDLPVKLKYSDIIFVMEDVDAASKVVYARGGSKKGTKAPKKKAPKGSGLQPEKQAAEPATSATASADPVGESNEGLKEDNVPSERVENASTTAPAGDHATKENGSASASKDGTPKAPPPPMPALLRSISTTESVKSAHDAAEVNQVKDVESSDAEEEDDEDKDESKKPEAIVGEMLCKMIAAADSSSDEKDGKKKTSPFMGPWKSSSYDGEDDLNLAGLLNVLDGVVDSPGRVVVMTTNHPEKLDPALIRPGRINKRIHLGYVNASSLCQMASHYMQVNLDETEREALGNVSKKISVAPAQVEQCCAESDTVAELIQHLKDLR